MFYCLSIRNKCLLLPETRERVKKEPLGSLSLLRPARLTACSFYHENNFFAKCFLQVLPRSIKLTLIGILFYGGGSWPKSNVTPFLRKTKWCQKIHRFGPKPPNYDEQFFFFLYQAKSLVSHRSWAGRSSQPDSSQARRLSVTPHHLLPSMPVRLRTVSKFLLMDYFLLKGREHECLMGESQRKVVQLPPILTGWG